MAEIKVLVEGYASKKKKGSPASSAAVLIFDGNIKVLVDPGSNAKALLEALRKEKIKPADIDIVFLTHYHLDHLLNIRLFPTNDIYDGDTISHVDKIISFSGGKLPKTNIKIIKTPGHAYEHCSLLAQTAKGKVAIAGDVFWWWNEQKKNYDRKKLLKQKDPFVKNKLALRQSRRKLLDLADYIIPGHGKMFKVEVY
ncbi:MAG: MBL fold metallo-hydrolase [Patescibacteria group bacterium]